MKSCPMRRREDGFPGGPQEPQAASNTQRAPVSKEKAPQGLPSFQVVSLDAAEPAGAAVRDRAVNLEPPFKFAGFVGTIASALMFSLAVFCVKLMPIADSVPEKVKIMTIRGVSLTILTALTILAQSSTFRVRRDEIFINFMRSVVGFFGQFGIYIAIQYITIAEASALAYSSPLWTCILGYFIFRERLPITLVVAFPLGALALILIAHPDLLLNVQDEVITELERHHHHLQLDNYTLLSIGSELNSSSHNSITTTTTTTTTDTPPEELQLELETEIYLEQRWPGVLIALGSSLILAIVNICLKFRKTTPIPTTSFYLGVASVVLGLGIQHFIVGFGAWPATGREWTLHAGVGLCSYLGQALLQWSLMYESAGTLSVVRTSDIVFSFVWSAVFLHEDLLWTSVLGAALIALVVALIMFNDHLQRLLASTCCCGRWGATTTGCSDAKS